MLIGDARGWEVSDSGSATDLYALLGVAPGADAAEIARAYRRRLRQVHPDTRTPAVVSEADAGTARRAGGHPDPAPTDLRVLQDAYLVLRDPLQRARYDAECAPGPDGCREQAARGRRGVPVPVRVRARPSRRQDGLIRVGPVRVTPLPPHRPR